MEAATPDPLLELPASWKAVSVRPRKNSISSLLDVELTPSPGCAFEYRGMHIYFATEMQTILQVDERVYVMLAAMLAGATYDETIELLGERGLVGTRSEISALLRGYRDLHLFDGPSPETSAEHGERAINALLGHQPMKMMLFMTQSCNLRCTYCYGVENNYTDSGEKMLPEVARSAVDYLFNSGQGRKHFYIYFFGGEPLLNLPTMEETVRYAKEKAAAQGKTVEFGVTTNGTLLSAHAVDLLMGEDFQICLSIDGPSELHNINRLTRGGGGSYERALAGYRRLQKASARTNQLKVRATMSHLNHDPMLIASHLDATGISNYGVGSAMERVDARTPTDLTKEDLLEMDASFEHFLSLIIAQLEAGTALPRYNPFFRTASSMTAGYRRAFIGCGLCRNDQGIGTDGSIYPCHRYVGLRNYSIGTVATGLDKEKVRRVYEQAFDVWTRHCVNCWARYICSGSCQWQYSHVDGELRNPLEYLCESTRRSVRRSIWTNVYLSRHHPDVFKRVCRREAASGTCCRAIEDGTEESPLQDSPAARRRAET